MGLQKNAIRCVIELETARLEDLMKSLIAALCVVLVILSFSCKGEIQVYRVGAVIPLSGSADAYGRNVRNGLTLALEDINKEGVNGKKMDLLIEDDATDAKVAAQKANQLAGAGVHVIIGGITSNLALSLIPACEQKKIVLISPTASSPKLTGASPYFFRNYPSDTVEGRIMAEYAIRRMKIRSVAILYIDNEYGHGITDVFQKRLEELEGVVVYEQTYPENSTDFSQYIKAIKESAPDAIYIPGYFSEMARILKEIQAQKVEAKIISVQGMATPMITEIAGDAAEGVVYPQPPYDPESDDPRIKKFVADYKAKFPIKPDVDAAFAYDALWIVAKAIEGSAEYPTDLRDRIADTNYRGLTGDITFDSGGDVDITPKMFQISGGKFVPIP